MIVRPIQTDRISSGEHKLTDFIDKFVHKLEENSVFAIASKVVSLCENNTVPINSVDLETLILEQADYYLPSPTPSNYRFTITQGILTARAGIDISRKKGYYILWPKDPQKSANEIRKFLKQKFKLKNVGVIITDSTSTPLVRGVTGIALSYSGFKPLNDYRTSRANLAGGLAASAVLTMGEGKELTPIAIISEVPFVQFQDHDPTDEELRDWRIPLQDDFFGSILQSADWQQIKK